MDQLSKVVNSTTHQAQAQHNCFPNVNVSLSLPDLLLECILAVQIARRYVREDLLGITDDDLRRTIQDAEAEEAECDGEEDSPVLSSDAIARSTNDGEKCGDEKGEALSRRKEKKKDFTKNSRASEAIKKLISSRLGIQTKGALAHKKEKEEAFDMVTTADKIAQEVIQRILIVRFSERAVAEDEVWAISECNATIAAKTLSSACCDDGTREGSLVVVEGVKQAAAAAAAVCGSAEKTIRHFPRLVEIAKCVCYDFEAGRRLPTAPSVRAKWVQEQQHFQRHDEQQGGAAKPSSNDKTQKQECCDTVGGFSFLSLLDLLPFTLIGEEETSRFVAVDDGSILSPSEFKTNLLHQAGPDRAAPEKDGNDDENPKASSSLDEQVQRALAKCVNVYLPETLGKISSLSQARCGTEGLFSVLCGAADKSLDAASLVLEELIPHFTKFRKFIEEKFDYSDPHNHCASSEPRALLDLDCPLVIKACNNEEDKEKSNNNPESSRASNNINNNCDNKNNRFGLINGKIRNSKATDEPFKIFPPASSLPSSSSSLSRVGQGGVPTANENNQGAATNNISSSSFDMFMSLLDLGDGCTFAMDTTTTGREESRDGVTSYVPTTRDDSNANDKTQVLLDSAALIPLYMFPLRIIERQALIPFLTALHRAPKGRGKGEEDDKDQQHHPSSLFDVERFDSLYGFDTSISFSALSPSEKGAEVVADAPPPRFVVLPLLVGTPDEMRERDGVDESSLSRLQRSLKAFDKLLDTFEKKDPSVLTQRHRALVAETFMATRFINLYTTLVMPEELEHTSQSQEKQEAKETNSVFKATKKYLHNQSVFDKLDALLAAYVVHRQRQFLRSLLRQRICVIIDPIDGTNAFTQGDRHAPMTLVGVAVDGEPVIGVTNRILSEKNLVSTAAGDKKEGGELQHVRAEERECGAVAVAVHNEEQENEAVAVKVKDDVVGSSTAELLGAIAQEYHREIIDIALAQPSLSSSSPCPCTSSLDCRDEFTELIVPIPAPKDCPQAGDGHRAEGEELELLTQKQTSQDGEKEKVSSLQSCNQKSSRRGYGTPAAWPFAHYFRDINEKANINSSNTSTATLSSKAKLMGQMIESVRIPREPLSYCLTWPSSASSTLSSLSHCVIDGEWIDAEARQQLALRQCKALLPFLLAEDEDASKSAESGGNEKTTENEKASLIVPSKIKLSDFHLVASVSSTTSEKALSTVSTIVSPFAPLPDRGAGNKLLAVAKGLSDTMVAPPNTIHKWDTLAPHAFLRSVGGDIVEAREGVSVVYPATHAAANAIFEAKREAVMSNTQFPRDAAELTSLPSGVVACQSAFIRSIVLRRIQNEKRHAFHQWLKGQKEKERGCKE